MTDLAPQTARTNQLVTDTRAFPRALQAKFLRVLADWGNVRAAAKAVGVARATAYRMRRQCITFRELWDAALLHARPMVEEVLADRALNGVQETVFYHGEEVATRTRYDSRLLLAHLARLDRLESNSHVREKTHGFDLQLEELARSPEREPVAAPFVSGWEGECDARYTGEAFPSLDRVSSVSNGEDGALFGEGANHRG